MKSRAFFDDFNGFQLSDNVFTQLEEETMHERGQARAERCVLRPASGPGALGSQNVDGFLRSDGDQRDGGDHSGFGSEA